MAKTKIEYGAVIDTPTLEEMTTHLDKHVGQWFAERARGLTPARFDHFGTVAGAAVTIPPPGDQLEGPRPGFCWHITVIRAWGLSTNDTLNIWRNNANEPRNFLGTLTVGSPVNTFGSKSLILKGGEHLVFTGTGLTATGDIEVNGEGFEVAEVDLYKIL